MSTSGVSIDTTLAMLALSGLIVTAFYIASLAQLFRTLRLSYPDEWHALGRPSVVEPGFSSALRVIRYLWRRDYLASRDPQVVRPAARARLLLLVFFVLCSLGTLVFYFYRF